MDKINKSNQDNQITQQNNTNQSIDEIRNQAISEYKVEFQQEIENEYIEMENKMMVQFAKYQKTLNTTDERVSKTSVRKYANYTSQQIEKFLSNPRVYQKELRQVSRFLGNTSPIYNSITGYLPSIAIDSPVVIPTCPDKKEYITKTFPKALKYLNVLSIPNVLPQVRDTLWKDGIIYGLEVETDKSYMLKILNPDFCRISSIEGNGTYVFQFDMSFFNINMKNVDCDETLLENYESIIPGLFKSAYAKYRMNALKYQWVEIPSANSMCLKMNEDIDYPCPPFASIYSDIDNIVDYKKLEKVSTEQSNYKIIGLKMPLMSGSRSERADNFAVKMSTAMQFYDLMRQSIDPSIGIFMTPMDAEAISFKDANTNAQNKVENATNELYNSLGFSKLLFNGENSTALKFSTAIDQSILFKVNRSIEKHYTKKFNQKFGYNFRLKLLDITVFNQKDMVDEYLKLAQYGVPTMSYVASAIGMNQSDLQALNIVDTEVFDIHNKFLPLMSSHTSTGDEGGRPEGEVTSDTGEATRENGDNENKANASFAIE